MKKLPYVPEADHRADDQQGQHAPQLFIREDVLPAISVHHDTLSAALEAGIERENLFLVLAYPIADQRPLGLLVALPHVQAVRAAHPERNFLVRAEVESDHVFYEAMQRVHVLNHQNQIASDVCFLAGEMAVFEEK